LQFLQGFPQFQIAAERFRKFFFHLTKLQEFPGEAPNNYIVLKGNIQDNMRQYHPIKMILPTNYPLAPPRVYFDKQLPVEVVQKLSYIGQQNIITIPYMQYWNPNVSSLSMLIGALIPIISAQPPTMTS